MSDEMEVLKHQLDRAVRGQYVKEEASTEYLLWLAGEHRRQIEAAHHALDMRGVARKHGDADLTIAGRIEELPLTTISELETTVREMRERIEREIRDMLVEQTRMIVKMADNLSGSLGHSIALLSAIDERDDIFLPPMDSIVEAGRTAIQAWQEAMPQIEQSLGALDDSEPS